MNFERRLGRVRLLANLWAEREQYYDGHGEWVLHPTAGFNVELTPVVTVGVEGWLNGEYGSGEAIVFNNSLHSYVGPSLLLQTGRLWWSAAPYVRLDKFTRSDEFGDEYAHLWVRSAVGLSL